MTDRTLVERCQKGDQLAWRRLVDDYAGLVYAVARSHHLPEDACDDVAQATFAALSRHIGRIVADAAIASWLITTATRESWRAARARRRRHDRPLPSHAGSDPSADLAALETHQSVRMSLARLGTKCRELLTALYFTSGQPDYDALAVILGMPRGSIGPTRARCLAKLAADLAESGSLDAGDLRK